VFFKQYYDQIAYYFETMQASQAHHLSQDHRMETTDHSLSDLFKQLGLPQEPEAVAQFIAQHQGACRHCSLLEAPIWTPSQLAFLNEAIAQDADWAGVAERLQADLA